MGCCRFMNRCWIKAIRSSSLLSWLYFLTITKRNPIPLSSHFLFFCPPSPWQPLIYFLSLWICLFWTFHINGIMQYVAFCVWLLSLNMMFSRFTHIVAIVHSFFMAEQYSVAWIDHILFIHQLMDIWAVSTLWLLWHNAAMNVCLQIFIGI